MRFILSLNFNDLVTVSHLKLTASLTAQSSIPYLWLLTRLSYIALQDYPEDSKHLSSLKLLPSFSIIRNILVERYEVQSPFN